MKILSYIKKTKIICCNEMRLTIKLMNSLCHFSNELHNIDMVLNNVMGKYHLNKKNNLKKYKV